MNYRNITVEKLTNATNKAINRADVLRLQIKNGEPNILEKMNEAELNIETINSRLSALFNLHPKKEIRDSAMQNLEKINNFKTKLSLDRGVFKAIEGIDTKNLDEDTKRAREKWLINFKRSGVNTNKKERVDLKKYSKALTKYSLIFSKFIAEGELVNVFMEDDLKGVSPTITKNLPIWNGLDKLNFSPFLSKKHIKQCQKKIKDGEICRIISTNPASFNNVLNFAQKEKVRKLIFLAYTNIAPKNERVLKNILIIKQKMMDILGYEHFAAYQFEIEMIKNRKNVLDFLTDLEKATKIKSRQEVTELLNRFKKDKKQKNLKKINAWDKNYYQEIVKKEKFGFNAKDLMPFFPYKQVEEAILDIFSKLFGIKFVLNTKFPVWHKDAKCFDVFKDNELLSRMILDMHPRKGKYNHAAFDILTPGLKNEECPEFYLMCNFSNGSKIENTLMQISEVETFFHEFGHMLHAIFGSKKTWMPLNGISTEWDFIETPSQFLEMWLEDKNVIKKIGKHYQTGDSIPDNLIQKYLSAKEFNKASFARRQIFFSMFALSIYDRRPDKVNFKKLWFDLAEKYSPTSYPKNSANWNSFGHLVGYAARYYCYLWSLALVYDIMTAFNKNDMMDPEPAKRFRDLVLKRGASIPAADMLHEFLGRPHSFEAFKNWLDS